MYGTVQILAEVKTKSPFGYASNEPWRDLFRLAERLGDIISVHTDPRWGGSFEILQEARALTKKPLLAKGIHERDEDIERALKLGADWVLVVGRMPGIAPDRCMIEPLTLKELADLPPTTRAVWNSRDLSNGELKRETFEEARKVFPGWLCQASNIRTCADIEKSPDAVLVGTHLRSFADSLK